MRLVAPPVVAVGDVSMESGLEGRNNIHIRHLTPGGHHLSLNGVRPRRPEQ